MHILMYLAGIGWILWSLPIFGLAKGGIHEVYGAIMISAGVLFLGLGCIIQMIARQIRHAQAPRPSSPSDANLADRLHV